MGDPVWRVAVWVSILVAMVVFWGLVILLLNGC